MIKKKIVFVAHHLTIGGVQKSLISALNAIDYNQNDVTLYLRKNRLVLLPYINKNVRVMINDDQHHYYRKPRAVYLQTLIKLKELFHQDTTALTDQLSQYIRRQRFFYEKKHFAIQAEYDIAIAYNEGYTAEFVMDCVPAKQKIMFFQSSVDEFYKLHQRIMPQFDKIAVEHDDIKESLLHRHPEIGDKIVVLRNYADTRLLRKLSCEIAVNIPNDRTTLCTCARFSHEKGIDTAIEAAKILKHQGARFLWYMLGDGPEMDNIKHLIALYGLEKDIKLMGMQLNPYPYMAACDIYVQPSSEEALSIAMLESQLLCAPIVSTKTVGGLAMIRDGVNGLLSEINAVSLAEKITLLMNDGQLKDQIKHHLMNTDHSQEEKRYRKDWENLFTMSL